MHPEAVYEFYENVSKMKLSGNRFMLKPPFAAAGPVRRCWSRRRQEESSPPVAAAEVTAAAAWRSHRRRLEESPPQP
ncbi:hypothetical protein Droror1_Dr00006400 [Drosera rotundifolia]